MRGEEVRVNTAPNVRRVRGRMRGSVRGRYEEEDRVRTSGLR